MNNHSIVDNFMQSLVQENKEKSTVKSYKNITSRYIKYLLEKDVDVFNYNHKDVMGFLENEYERGISTTTIKKITAAINAFSEFINVAVEIKLNDLDLFKGQEENINDVIVLHKETQWKMYKYVPKVVNKRNISIVLLILETGIKTSELVGLNKEDLQELNGAPYIKINSKNKRTLPISRELYSHIKEVICNRTDQSLALFVSNFEKRISVRTVASIISNYGELTAQILRNTYIYNLIENDTDTFLIAQLAGLKNPNIIVNYYNRDYLFINEFYEVPG